MNKSWNREVFVSAVTLLILCQLQRWRSVDGGEETFAAASWCRLTCGISGLSPAELRPEGSLCVWTCSMCFYMIAHTHTHSVCVSLCCQLLCTVSVNAKGKTSREARGNDLFHSRLLQFHSAFFFVFHFYSVIFFTFFLFILRLLLMFFLSPFT